MKKTIVALIVFYSLAGPVQAEAMPSTFGIKAGLTNSVITNEDLTGTADPKFVNLGFPIGLYGSYTFAGFFGIGLDVTVLLGKIHSEARQNAVHSFNVPRLHINLRPALYPFGTVSGLNVHLIAHCGIPIADGELSKGGQQALASLVKKTKDNYAIAWGGGAGIGFTISYLILELDCIYEFTDFYSAKAATLRKLVMQRGKTDFAAHLLCVSLTAGFNFAALL